MEGNWEKALKNPTSGPWHWKVVSEGSPLATPGGRCHPEDSDTRLGQDRSHPAPTHPGDALIAVQPQQHLLLGMMLGSPPSVGTPGGWQCLVHPHSNCHPHPLCLPGGWDAGWKRDAQRTMFAEQSKIFLTQGDLSWLLRGTVLAPCTWEGQSLLGTFM